MNVRESSNVKPLKLGGSVVGYESLCYLFFDFSSTCLMLRTRIGTGIRRFGREVNKSGCRNINYSLANNPQECCRNPLKLLPLIRLGLRSLGFIETYRTNIHKLDFCFFLSRKRKKPQPG